MEATVTDTLLDSLSDLLEATGREGITPSVAGRKVKVSTNEARAGLEWLVENRFAHTVGNGAWTRYRYGAAGSTAARTL